jgi:radical SAM superfamily enzyme YgiQ (UPF0313 family)
VSANPEPLADICDAFVIGEAEQILPLLLGTLRSGISGDRQALLRDLAKIPGVYVPAYPGIVERQWVRTLDAHPTHTSILTAATEFGDMYLLEIARGCAHRCRFCLTGCLYRPRRERSPASLLDTCTRARHARKVRDKVGLVSAAVSDYTHLDELMRGLADLNLRVAVSSLRVDPLPDVLLAALAASGTRTLTLAPEAGSERLRAHIGKDVYEKDILQAAQKAAQFGFSELKLYFMIGLPTEEDEDVLAIPTLFEAISRVYGGRMSASVAVFVPKAHTPFERAAMAQGPVLKQRLANLKRSLQAQRVRVSSDGIPWAFVQAVLARGDRRLGGALAAMRGSSLMQWNAAVASFGLADRSLVQARSPHEILPWSNIRLGPT